MTDAAADSWLTTPRPNPRARLRLFCLAYAGGAASIFWSWPRMLPMSVEVCGIERPGSGGRLLEKPFTAMAPLVESLAEALRPWLDRPFAVYGHSLGALIGFELLRQLRRADPDGSLPRAARLLVSGATAPDATPAVGRFGELDDRELVTALHRLGGTPQSLQVDSELMSLVLPGLRADLELLGAYRFDEEPPLAVPISAFAGRDDALASPERVARWSRHSAVGFACTTVAGGHFFLHENQAELLPALCLELKEIADASAPRSRVGVSRSAPPAAA